MTLLVESRIRLVLSVVSHLLGYLVCQIKGLKLSFEMLFLPHVKSDAMFSQV